MSEGNEIQRHFRSVEQRFRKEYPDASEGEMQLLLVEHFRRGMEYALNMPATTQFPSLAELKAHDAAGTKPPLR